MHSGDSGKDKLVCAGIGNIIGPMLLIVRMVATLCGQVEPD